MIPGSKQQANCEKGEIRTRNLLSKRFWVLRRNIDVDGADFLIQIPADSHAELVSRGSEILGVVQAKFFEGSNQVRISRAYVETSEGPRSDFFAFLHTDLSDDTEVHYFFTAYQIADYFYISSCGEYYCFSLTKKRSYAPFQNLTVKSISEQIYHGLDAITAERNSSFLMSFYHFRGVTRTNIVDSYVYMLRRVESTNIVLVKIESDDDCQATLLEPRRDLFSYSGGFAWGYAGTGPQFLCASILGHHLGSRPPTLEEREALLRGLIEKLTIDPAADETPLNITTAMIDQVLGFEREVPTNFIVMFREEFGELDAGELEDAMVLMIGALIIPLVENPDVTAIYKNPHENFIRAAINAEPPSLVVPGEVDTEVIRRFISAAAIYSGQPLNSSNALLHAKLSNNGFMGSSLHAAVPPITEGFSFTIITPAG